MAANFNIVRFCLLVLFLMIVKQNATGKQVLQKNEVWFCNHTSKPAIFQKDSDQWTEPVLVDFKFPTLTDGCVLSAPPYALNRVALILVKYPKWMLKVTVHTDNVGSPAYNKQLSKARANAVKKYLVERHNIEPSRIVCEGKGSEQPICNEKSEECNARNRRIEVRFKEVETKK